MPPDAGLPRWRRRLDEFGRAIDLLERTDAIRQDRPLTEAEEAGLVQFFELAVELGWKTMALYLRSGGLAIQMAPLPVVREAMRARIIDDGDAWSEAIERRNIMAHTYDPGAFRALVADAPQRFLPIMRVLRDRMADLD